MALTKFPSTNMAETPGPQVGSSIVVGVLAFVAVSAWVAVEIVPEALRSYRPDQAWYRPAPVQATMIPVSASLSPNEVVVADAPPDIETPSEVAAVPAPASVPVAPPARRATFTTTRTKALPPPPIVAPPRAPILVERRRLSQDERIELEVMDRLASDPRLGGRIAVVSKEAVVRLTGWTRTVGQARHAENDARSVRGVRHVQNDIRARVGGSI